MSGVVGVGLVGAGLIFERHAAACARLADRARLLAIADVDEARLRTAAAAHAVPFACRDYRELLCRDDVDVVTVCTPPCLHEPVVVDALRAGKYVICEKPLAHTLEAADRVLEVARGTPGRLTVVYQFRYLPDVQRAVWLRDNERLGPLLFGRFSRYARYRWPSKPPEPGKAPKPKRRDWWGRWDVAGGGAAMTQLIHELDLMCHVFGRASEVWGVMDTLKEPIEAEDTCAATVRFESGAIGCCYCTVSAQRSAHGFDIFGALASVHSPWAFECMDSGRRREGRAAARAVYPDVEIDPEDGAHTACLEAVLDAIAAGRPLPIGPEEARASLELCAGIYASALTGAPVSLPIEEGSPYYAGVSTSDYDGRQRSARRRLGALPRAEGWASAPTGPRSPT